MHSLKQNTPPQREAYSTRIPVDPIDRTPSKAAPPAKSAFDWRALVLALYRHKIKIVVLGLLGLTAAYFYYQSWVPKYQTTAKIMVRYVLERGILDDFEAQRDTGGHNGGSILNGEMQILLSTDTAETVANLIGPEKVLGPDLKKDSPLDPVKEAQARIIEGLEASVIPDTNVIEVSYENTRSENTKEVLQSIISKYQEKHLKIHRSLAALEPLEEDVTRLKKRIQERETEILKLKKEQGFLTLEGSSESLEEQRGLIASQLDQAEAEYAGKKARVSMAQTIESEDESSAGIPKPKAIPIPSSARLEFSDLIKELEIAQSQRDARLKQYTPSDIQAQKLSAKVNGLKQRRAALVATYPKLLQSEPTLATPDTSLDVPHLDIQTPQLDLAEAEARFDTLQNQAEKIEKKLTDWSQIGNLISGLEREKEIDETNYRILETSLKQARIDATMDSSRLTNINILDTPTDPVLVVDDDKKKILLGLAGSGFALGIGLALLIELILDRRVKAPGELTTRLHVPLLLSIPYLAKSQRGTKLIGDDESSDPKRRSLITTASALPSRIGTPDQIKVWAESIRNRLLFGYEINRVNHKPKLIAVAGNAHGAGATTVAQNLSKAFADIDHTKVLYVDLNHAPCKTPSIEDDNFTSAVLPKSRMLKERGREENKIHLMQLSNIPGRGLSSRPLQLQALLPEFSTSEYDYIVMDMPPVDDETSPTFAMAGMVDQLLLVLDAQNTGRDSLKKVYSHLTGQHASVSCIFNKTKVKGPSWLIE